MLARLGQRNRHTLATRTPRAADAMHVRFGRCRHVVVHHMRHMLDIESASRDVGRHQQIGLVGAELLHHAIALILTQTAMQRFTAIAARVHRLGELVDFGTRATENDR